MSDVAPEPTLEYPLDYEETLYQNARRDLAAPKPFQLGGLVLLGLFLFFVGSQFDGLASLPGIGVLVAVLLFHEAGHYLGMRVFGFQNVQMFFIPFFGAAVSGRARGAAAWKDATVSLLGPVPGIVLGAGMFALLALRPAPLLLTVAQTLVFLNAFNLLPLGGLDGGRFLQRVLFARHRVLEVLFLAGGAVVLGLVAWALEAPMMGIFAFFGLVGLPARWRILSAAATLRARYPALEPDPTRLDEETGRALFSVARGSLEGPAREQSASVASVMESVLEAARPPPGVLASILLLGTYAVAWVVAIVVVFALVVLSRPVEWRRIEQPAWSAELPCDLAFVDEPVLTAAGERSASTASCLVEGLQRFTVTIVPAAEGADPAAWFEAEKQRLAELVGAPVASETQLEGGVRELVLRNAYRQWRVRLRLENGQLYSLLTAAPEETGAQKRFFESFATRVATGP